jgi:hypothetical protein
VNVVCQDAPLFLQMHRALAQLLACYFNRTSYFQAGCKVYLHELLYYLAQHFRAAESPRSELIREQDDAAQLKPVFRFVCRTITPNRSRSAKALRWLNFVLPNS